MARAAVTYSNKGFNGGNNNPSAVLAKHMGVVNTLVVVTRPGRNLKVSSPQGHARPTRTAA